MAIDGESVTLDAGETQRTVVDEDAVLILPNVAEIRVRAGTGSKSLAVERRHAQEELRRLCAAANVADQAEARQAAEQRKEAKRQHRDARDTIKRDLRDLTVDVLRGKVEGLTKRIGTYAAERPKDPPLPSDFEIAKQIAAAKARSVGARRADSDTCDQAAASAAGALHDERINRIETRRHDQNSSQCQEAGGRFSRVCPIPASRQSDHRRSRQGGEGRTRGA